MERTVTELLDAIEDIDRRLLELRGYL